MENQAMQNNSITPVNPIVQIEQTKKNNFLVILLSVLLLISLGITGFFAYQTQKLTKELKEFKNQNLATPTPEPESTFPMYTEPSPDPTANWKTYKNTSSNYEIKYPTEWKVVNQSAGSIGVVVANSRYIEIGLGEGKSGTIGIEELQLIPPSEETNLNTTKVVGNITLRCNGKFTNDTKTWCWIKVPGQEKYLNIQVFKTNDENINLILDQILSTFKFTN